MDADGHPQQIMDGPESTAGIGLAGTTNRSANMTPDALEPWAEAMLGVATTMRSKRARDRASAHLRRKGLRARRANMREPQMKRLEVSTCSINERN